MPLQRGQYTITDIAGVAVAAHRPGTGDAQVGDGGIATQAAAMVAIEFGDQFAEPGAFDNEHAIGPGLRYRVQCLGRGNAMARESGLLAGTHYQFGIGGGEYDAYRAFTDCQPGDAIVRLIRFIAPDGEAGAERTQTATPVVTTNARAARLWQWSP